MKCAEIIQRLERIAPRYLAEKWDNVGLLAGRKEKEVKKIMLALDPTGSVIEEAIAWQADMLITHHPLIFSGMKSVTTEDFIGKRVYQLIQNDICYYAMHTNFDVMGMADAAADKLKLQECQVLDITFQDEMTKEGIGKIGMLPNKMTLKECAFYIKESFQLPSIKVFGNSEQEVEKVALVPGSGKDYISHALSQGADILITGDIGHHNGLDALEREIAVIDAGHYGLEKIFSSYMEAVLKKELPEIEMKKAVEHEPYWTLI